MTIRKEWSIMKTLTKRFFAILFAFILIMAVSVPVFAAENPENAQSASAQTQESEKDNSTSTKAIAAAMCVGIAATAGAVSMGITISKTNDGISRQPEAQSALRTSLMLGLVFIETAIIYALIVAIFIIFVL